MSVFHDCNSNDPVGKEAIFHQWLRVWRSVWEEHQIVHRSQGPISWQSLIQVHGQYYQRGSSTHQVWSQASRNWPFLSVIEKRSLPRFSRDGVFESSFAKVYARQPKDYVIMSHILFFNWKIIQWISGGVWLQRSEFSGINPEVLISPHIWRVDNQSIHHPRC